LVQFVEVVAAAVRPRLVVGRRACRAGARHRPRSPRRAPRFASGCWSCIRVAVATDEPPATGHRRAARHACARAGQVTWLRCRPTLCDGRVPADVAAWSC